jgi:hypothetical protein
MSNTAQVRKASPKGNPSKKSSTSSFPWAWVIAALFIIGAVFLWYWQTSERNVFQIVGGEKSLLVLLRNEKSGEYTLRYVGRKPAQLESLKVMLGGEILHMDVMEVVVNHQGEEYVLSRVGKVPPGTAITLNPGDEFTVRVTFLGQTLGGNYLYGFRLGYSLDGRARTYDLMLEYEYAVFVE